MQFPALVLACARHHLAQHDGLTGAEGRSFVASLEARVRSKGHERAEWKAAVRRQPKELREPRRPGERPGVSNALVAGAAMTLILVVVGLIASESTGW